MTVQDIFDFLNDKFPVNTACDFDNVGILIGDPDTEVTGAVIALDCTPSAIKTAKENGCQLIITHHPVIFTPLKTVCASSVAFELIKSGISVISMHTNLDIAENGVTDTLCDVLQLENAEKMITEDGFTVNVANFPVPLTSDELALFIKQKLGGAVKYLGTDKKISRVLVCSGSGGGYLQDAAINECDALITAEVKHNVFIDAERLNIAVFDAGHYNTEDIIVEPLKKLLSDKFCNICFLSNHNSEIKIM